MTAYIFLETGNSDDTSVALPKANHRYPCLWRFMPFNDGKTTVYTWIDLSGGDNMYHLFHTIHEKPP